MNHVQTTADMTFLCRAMGAPVPQGADVERWYAGALAHPARRAMAEGAIVNMLAMLPTEEDFARMPVETPKRNAVPIPSQDPRGLCVCESGRMFDDCHGLDSFAEA